MTSLVRQSSPTEEQASDAILEAKEKGDDFETSLVRQSSPTEEQASDAILEAKEEGDHSETSLVRQSSPTEEQASDAILEAKEEVDHSETSLGRLSSPTEEQESNAILEAKEAGDDFETSLVRQSSPTQEQASDAILEAKEEGDHSETSLGRLSSPTEEQESNAILEAKEAGDDFETFLVRQSRATEEHASNAILEAIEAGYHAEVRDIISRFEQDGNIKSILTQSMSMEHELRTPLMAAAATGDLGLFKTVLGAVQRATGAGIESNLFDQLIITDSKERTLVMHAARAGNVAILEIVLECIKRSKKWELLLHKDYVGKTVLMHAVSSGQAAVFKSLFSAIRTGSHYPKQITEKKVIAHILRTSDDGRTIIMHAARCGNHRSLSAVVLACKKNIKLYQMRKLLKEVDDEEMTFLMHASAGCCEGTADDAESERKKIAKKRKEEKKKQEERKMQQNQSNVARGNLTATSVGLTAGVSESKGEETKESGVLEEGKSMTSGSGAAAATPLEDEPEREIPSAMTSSEPRGGQANQQAARSSSSKFKVPEKEVLMFRVAWLLVKEVLWKEQVRDQLKAKDCCGRTLLTHAIISGRLQVFDIAFDTIRENILDHEIEDLTGINRDDNEVTVMEELLDNASKDMVNLVHQRDQELKKSVAIREKESTIEAKIQSFIPGKSVVIFQLLLPEMESPDAALILLIVMSVLAPIFAYSGNLITKETSSSCKNTMISPVSILLSAPAMWWWGIGTSSIAYDSFGWSDTASAASLAVATIVIPALDQFLGSHKMERVYDRVSLRKRRFTRQVSPENWIESEINLSKLNWDKMETDDGDSKPEVTNVQIEEEMEGANEGDLMYHGDTNV